MAMQNCSKCGSTQIDHGEMSSAGAVGYKSDRHKIIFHPNTRADVCMACGFVEMYVDTTYREKIRKAESKG